MSNAITEYNIVSLQVSHMVSQSSSPSYQQLEGTIESLVFQNEETGFTVARLQPKNKQDNVMIVGNLAGMNVGESVSLRGFWASHPQYGRQFEVRFYTVQLPATITGLRKYLGSGLIKGIGPVTAKRIVAKFGLDTLEIIEKTPERLADVEGVGQKRMEWITHAWAEQKQVKEIMLFLQEHEISTSLAVKIYKQYGNASISIVRTDPYRLAEDIFGIGFKTADKIARQLGLALDSPSRLRAGLTFTLGEMTGDGHCFSLRDPLLKTASELLEVPAAPIEAQMGQMITHQDLIAEDDAIYLPPFYHAERSVAAKIRRMQARKPDNLALFHQVDWDNAFAWLDAQSAIRLTDQQKAAVKMALTEKVSILTGGPGTGKSTITRSIIQLLDAKNRSTLLAAPTGRAAKRLSEATGREAKTIHRLLEYKPSEGNRFLRDQTNPLESDLIIIDETSMVDLLLFNHLLSAVDAGSHFLVVGDQDQLPSVGPGNVLRDLIDSGVVAVTRLDTIFRQAEDSYIIVNAHRINRGEMPLLQKNSRDFYHFVEDDPQKAADRVLDLVTQRIPAKFGFNPLEDIQVLSPMHRGSVGVSDLNQRLQEALNPPSPKKNERKHGYRTFREGDRVMQIRNDYDRKVFNGDMGKIIRIDLEDQVVTVNIDGHPVEYDYTQLDELVHAYAVSIHKSQGSEFPVAVIPMLSQHFMMLQRNLLYTAVTRAQKLVVLVGSKKAIAIAVRNNRIAQRNTRLSKRLQEWKEEKKGYDVEDR